MTTNQVQVLHLFWRLQPESVYGKVVTENKKLRSRPGVGLFRSTSPSPEPQKANKLNDREEIMKRTTKHKLAVVAISAALLTTPLVLLVTSSPLHINDHHSHLKSNNLDLKLDGERTRVKAGGMASVQTKIEDLSSQGGNILKLHAGDAITGDLYFALFKGEADAAMMNSICFDAFALGNHEFDDGDAGLAKFLNHLKEGSCNTPVLAPM